MVRVDQRGVSVIELLVAMFLLAIALVGLAASFPYAMFGVSAGGLQTTATLLAQQGIETAKNTPYANLPSLDTGGFVGPPVVVGPPPTPALSYEGFQRSITVATATPPTTTTVTVVVRFSGVTPAPIYDTTLITIIAQ